MALLPLLQEAQARHRLAEPPTASCAAPEVHRVCRQGDPPSAGMKPPHPHPSRPKKEKKANPLCDFSPVLFTVVYLSVLFRLCPG